MNKCSDVNPKCDPCEANFQKEVNKLVDNVEGYNEKDHEKKQKELDAAFEEEKKKK